MNTTRASGAALDRLPAWLATVVRTLGRPGWSITFGLIAIVALVAGLVLRVVAPETLRDLAGVPLDPRSIALGFGVLATLRLHTVAPEAPATALWGAVLGIVAVLGAVVWFVVALIVAAVTGGA